MSLHNSFGDEKSVAGRMNIDLERVRTTSTFGEKSRLVGIFNANASVFGEEMRKWGQPLFKEMGSATIYSPI